MARRDVCVAEVSRSRTVGISLLLASKACWPTTTQVAWSKAGDQMARGLGAAAGAAPGLAINRDNPAARPAT